MEIDLQTKIANLLEAYPDIEDTLLKLSPIFAKIQNPVLRHTVAKVTSVQQAAKIAGISPIMMVQTLCKAAGLTAIEYTEICDKQEEEQAPIWFDESRITIRFDAATVIQTGNSPMADILRLAKELNNGCIMEVIVSFKPEPIMDILRTKNLQVWYNGDGKSYFMK